MRIELLAIGEEFLTGSLVDTNSAYIAEQCNLLGLRVTRINCVGDDLTYIQNILKEITFRADILIATGGLGPTPDDLTREAASRSANVSLELYPEALEEIESYFVKLGVDMPESNKAQAIFPRGAQYLKNPIGTAPGFALKIGKTECFFTPGVPREMQKMLHEQIIPIIKQKFSAQFEESMILNINTFGLSEAIIGEHLKVLGQEFPKIKFGTRFTFPTIQIKAYANSINLEDAKIAIKARMGNWCFTDGSRTMRAIVDDLLKQEQSSLAFLEIEDEENAETIKNLAKTILITTKAAYSLVFNSSSTEETRKSIIVLADQNSTGCYSTILNFRDKYSRKEIFTTLALDLLRRKLLKLEVPNKYFGVQLLKS